MRTVPVLTVVLALSACGVGGNGGASQTAAAQLTGAGSVQFQGMSLPAAAGDVQAEPLFHVAPVVLAEPGELDAAQPDASAAVGPHRQAVTAELSQLSTRHLTQGAIESVLRDGIVPPTINLENPDVTTAMDLVPLKPRKLDVNVAMSNSFGFGGTNAALILAKV